MGKVYPHHDKGSGNAAMTTGPAATASRITPKAVQRHKARRDTPGAGLASSRPDALIALRRARDLIDRDFAQPLTLDSMATAAHLSRFHFARAFAKAYGETPRAYLTRRRIERAKDLLRAANLTVTEICFLVGFESVGSFSSRFRDLVGMSPTEYRNASSGTPPIPGCVILMWTRPSPPEVSNPEEAQTTDAP